MSDLRLDQEKTARELADEDFALNYKFYSMMIGIFPVIVSGVSFGGAASVGALLVFSLCAYILYLLIVAIRSLYRLMLSFVPR